MLHLEAPFHTIEGVAVFRDHERADQWYYMPGTPRLSTLVEPVPGGAPGEVRRVPQLSLIKFRGTAGTGGFLNFDVDLGLDPELLDEVAAQVKRLEGLDRAPRLAALPVVDGTVRMMLFDKESPQPPPPGGGPQPGPGGPVPGPAEPGAERLQFVLRLTHAAKPALYGDNRAAFSVQLTQEGVTTLEAALRGELSPIGIVYSLDFLGLRPAYHVSVQVDWERIQKHLEEHEEWSVPLIAQSSIDTLVDELEESRAITITADTFVLEDDGSPVVARRDQALDDVRDMITETFFEPSVDPIDTSDDADTGVRTAGRILQAIASAGASENCLFRRRSVDVTRIDRKRLDVQMSERTTVKRTVYPQGHLSGLFRLLREPGMDMSRFVTEVDLDDPWFQRRTVEVISRADHVRDSIRSVSVELDYAGQTRSVLLTADHPRETVTWSSVLAGGGMVREVAARFTVDFAGVDGTERPLSLTSAWETTRADALEIEPRELYGLTPIPVVALSYPWERYPSVEVEVAHDEPDAEVRQADVLVLDQASPERSWDMFVRDPAMDSLRYRVTHRAADQRDQVGPWVTTDQERILVRDPFPNGLVLDVVPVLDWTTVARAFVDLVYADAAHGIREEASLEFSATAPQTQSFRVRLADPTRRDVAYRVTLIGVDGTVTEVPPSVTAERRITLRADMRGHRIVRIRPEDVDFTARRVRQVQVDLRFLDPDHGLDIADTVVLRSGADRGTFEFDYVDPTRTGYQVQVVTTFTNNLTRTRPWTPSDEPELVVAVG